MRRPGSGAGEPIVSLRLREFDVLAVFQHRTQRGCATRAVETLDPERLERGHPVDRLRNPWLLLQVEASKSLDRRNCLPYKGNRSLGYPASHDAGGVLDVRI